MDTGARSSFFWWYFIFFIFPSFPFASHKKEGRNRNNARNKDICQILQCKWRNKITVLMLASTLWYWLQASFPFAKQANGIGLLAATVENFLEKPHQCPHVLLTTHFHTLNTLLPSSPLLSYQVITHSSFPVIQRYPTLLHSASHAFGLQLGTLKLNNVHQHFVVRTYTEGECRALSSNWVYGADRKSVV